MIIGSLSSCLVHVIIGRGIRFSDVRSNSVPSSVIAFWWLMTAFCDWGPCRYKVTCLIERHTDETFPSLQTVPLDVASTMEYFEVLKPSQVFFKCPRKMLLIQWPTSGQSSPPPFTASSLPGLLEPGGHWTSNDRAEWMCLGHWASEGETPCTQVAADAVGGQGDTDTHGVCGHNRGSVNSRALGAVAGDRTSVYPAPSVSWGLCQAVSCLQDNFSE